MSISLSERFEHGRVKGADGKLLPPWSTQILAYLALLTLRPPATSEQVAVILSFTFLCSFSFVVPVESLEF